MSIIQGIIGTVQGGGSPPYFNVYSHDSYVDEGSYGYVNYEYSNQPGRTLYWTISHATTNNDDFTGSTSGSFYMNGSGSGNFYYQLTADLTTEGDQYFYIYIGTSPGDSDVWSTTVHINDTSTTVPLYNWSPFGGSQRYPGNAYAFYDNSGLAAGTGEFAFESLVWIDSAAQGGRTGGQGFILGQGTGWTGYDGGTLQIWFEGNCVYVKIDGYLVSDNSIDTSGWYDQWFRLAVARCSDGYVNVFKNGIRVSRSGQAWPNALTNTRFDLGTQRSLAAVDGNYMLHGNMTNIHFNTNATYVNTKFNVTEYVDESATYVTKTTGTQLLINAATDSAKGTDLSDNSITAQYGGTGTLEWSQRNPIAAPVLWLDPYYTESYPGYGTKWTDLGSSTHGATLYNNPGFDNTFKALVFDSRSNCWADGANLGSSTFNSASAWVKIENFGNSTWPPSNTNSSACLFTEVYPGTSSKVAFALGGNLTFDDSSKITAGSYNGSWHVASPSFTPSTGVWYHLTMTQGDNGIGASPNVKFYVNGQLVGEGAGGAIYTSNGNYRIARRWDNAEYFPGTIGSIQKYNIALTAEQVQTLFNSQKDRFLPPTASYTMSDSGTVTEGTQVTYSVTTTNIDNGTTMYYWKKSGTAVAADVDALSGTFTVNSNAGQFTITPTIDYLTEGIDTLTIAIGVVNGTELFSDQLVINNSNSTPPSLYEIVTYNLVGPAANEYAWPSIRLGDSQTVYSMVHGSWARDGDYQGGVIFTPDSYIEMPVNVDTNQFTISLIADFTTNSGWNSIFSTGNLNDSGYTCWYITGSGNSGTFSIVSNYGSEGPGVMSTFECTQTDFSTRSHWAFVINTSGGSDATQIYRNGVALTKISSNLVTPTSYGSHTLIVGTRMQGGYPGWDTVSGNIYRIHAIPTAWSQMQAQAEYGSLTSLYGL